MTISLCVVSALATVLYRDLPKYNDRRRNLWLPEVVHQQRYGLQRTMSNPSLYGHHVPSSRYSARVQNSPAWYSGCSDEGVGMQRHWADTIRSVSSTNSAASFPSNMVLISSCYCCSSTLMTEVDTVYLKCILLTVVCPDHLMFRCNN